MDFESSGLSREEIRRKRKQKERIQAFAILAAVLLVVALVVGGVVFGLIRMFSDDKKEENVQVDAVTTEQVVAEETVTEEPVVEEEAEPVTEEPAEAETETEAEAEDEPEEEQSQSVIDEILGTEDTAALDKLVSEKIASMTLEEKVAGLFFVTPAQLMGLQSDVTVIGSDFGNYASTYPVGGILFDESNMLSEQEFATFISNVKTYVVDDTFFGIENKGGEDAPFVTAGFTENVIASHQEIGANLGASGAYSAGISVGSELRQYSIDVNFSPNIDVSLEEGSLAAKEGFGADMATTAELGKNYVKGLSDQEINVAVGHFPSYGDVTHNGDGGQLVSDRTKEDLLAQSTPYLEAIDAGADFLMISHIGLPKIRGDQRPASLSKEVITDIVRTEWEYDGIVITDFMNRSCMYQKYTYAEAAVGAIEAGADMILSPKNFQKSYNGILDAVNDGTLTEERIDESLKRIYRVKYAGDVTN